MSGTDFAWHGQDFRILFMTLCYDCQEYFFFRYAGSRWSPRVAFTLPRNQATVLYLFGLAPSHPMSGQILLYRIFQNKWESNEGRTRNAARKREEKKRGTNGSSTWIGTERILQVTFRVNETAGKRGNANKESLISLRNNRAFQQEMFYLTKHEMLINW